MRISDVGRFMFVGHHQTVDSVDQIGNVAETARLFSRAVNGDGLPGQRLINEIRQGAAVIEAHARPVGVEDADDVRVQALGAVIGHHHGFRKALGFVVNAARADRVDIAPVGFRLRADVRIAVTFRRGREEILGLLRQGQPQGIVRSERAHFQSLDRELQIVDRACRRSEMQNVIDRARDIDKFGDIVLDDPESRISREMAQVGGSAGDQVVDRENLPAAIEEVVAKVRPEKSRASRDYRAQRAGLSMQMFSVRLRFFMISSFPTRSSLANTLNFIVAAAILCTKSGSADQSRIITAPQSPQECDEDLRAAIDLHMATGLRFPSPPYDDAPRPLLFATMLSVL